MAHLTTDLLDGKKVPFLMIDHSVGRHGRNLRDDVLLIQFLLNQSGSYKNRPKVELSLDGICGPDTRAAILQFQKAVNVEHGYKELIEDATVSSIKGDFVPGTAHFTTLYMLNQEF